MKHVTQLKVLFSGEPVGLLLLRDRQCWFQYDAHWLQHGFDLSPQTMPFSIQPQLPLEPTFHGLHGVFHDSLPDGWGLLLMDRFFKRQFHWDPHEITLTDRLASLHKRPMGALEYEPAMQEEVVSETVDLMALAHDAERVLSGKSRAVLNQLRLLGGSPGGARPKVTVGLSENSDECVSGLTDLPAGFSHWLVKFRGMDDPKDAGCIEKSYMDMAVMAGIKMPRGRLIQLTEGKKHEVFYAVERFDREGNIKRHMLTLSGYLYADHRLPSLDYNALLTATGRLTHDIQEIRRAFRLMVFNILAHNRDDHTKNFAFLHSRSGQWELAPGFDLTFSSGMGNQHTTAINGSGNPSRKDIQTIAVAHSIDNWESILDEVMLATTHWKNIAMQNQVTKQSIKQIAAAIDTIRKRLRR